MNDNSDNWTEFEWEEDLRESDEYAAKYFKLLKRFCDLPGAHELIADRMGPDFEDKLPDCELDCDTCPHRWECDSDAPQEWLMNAAGHFDQEDDEDEENEREQARNLPLEPGDELYYEADRTFIAMRQTALGWCNIYAAVLPTELRPSGLNVLYDIGRACANLGYSISDGLYEQPAASVAFAKRSLGHLNRAMGHMARLEKERPRLKPLLQTMKTHLLKTRSAVVDHLEVCRKKMQDQK